MKKIAVFTGTRAEYGILYWLLKDIQADQELQLQLVVSAMHLSPEFGYTKSVIEADGFKIDAEVEMLLSSNSAVGNAKSIGLGVVGFADSLARLQPDILVVLGDRFEALAIAQTAMMLDIPVAHLHGGEITQGVKDDAIRHAITKFSHLHFTSCEPYRQRVIQLGEQPKKVFNVGALGLEAIRRADICSKQELSESIEFDLHSPYFLVTYHPVNLAQEPPETSFLALTQALDNYPKHQVIITYPNADDGGRAIMPLIEDYAAQNPERIFAIKSLGHQRYLAAVKHASAVVGNSSSGIIEVAELNTPVVNIGERQKGRLSASSVIDCSANEQAITDAIEWAITSDFSYGDNPYGSDNCSQKIIDILKSAEIESVKEFYDINQDDTKRDNH